MDITGTEAQRLRENTFLIWKDRVKRE